MQKYPLGTGQLKVDDASFLQFNVFNANHGRYEYQVTSNGIDDIVLNMKKSSAQREV